MQTLLLILNFAAMVPGGILMGMTVLRFLPQKCGWPYTFISVFLFSTTIGMPSWIGDENPLFLFPFFLAAFLLCYKEMWYANLIVGVIFYTLLIPLNMMIDTAFIFIMHPSDFSIVAAKTILWGVIWLLVRRFVSKKICLFRSVKLWALLGSLSLAPLFSTLSLTIWHISEIDAAVYDIVVPRLAYIILPFTVLSAMALLAALVVLSRHEELEQQQKLAEIQSLYYQGLQREQSEVRKLKHDLNNHITVAQGLLEQGDIPGTKRYLEDLCRSPALTGSRRICANEIANAVLSNKTAVMEREGIQTDLEISLPQKLSVSDIDLCALLGNALDNAIEAVKQAQDKRVIIRIRADKGVLMLRVENEIGILPRREQGKFKTTKDDRNAHGIGLSAMQDIARRYGGSLEVTAENGRFELVAYLQIKKEGKVDVNLPL